MPSNRKFACVLPSLCLLVWWFSALCRPLSLFSQSQPFLPSFALCHQSLRLRVFVHCGIRSTLATLAAGLALTLSDRLLAKQSRTGLRCHSLLNCVGVLGHSASGFGLEGLNTVRERILPRRNLPAAQLRKFPSARKTDADEDGDGRTDGLN